MTSPSPRRRRIIPASARPHARTSPEGAPRAGEALGPAIERFLEAIERAQYEALAGLSDDPGLVAIYDRYAPLFEPTVFADVAPPDGASEEDARRAALREFLALGIEGHRTRALQEAVLAAEAEASAAVDGETVPYRQLPVRVRQEPDRARRAALEEARLAIVAKQLNPFHHDILAASHAVADELLGLPYDQYCFTLAGLDFDALETQCDALLAETRDAHDDLLRHYVRRMLPGVRPDQVRTHDLARLLHGSDFSDQFPGDTMLHRMARPMTAMGIDWTADGRVEFDLEPRPTKTPRAFCAAIRVPDEVKLVLQPYGGHDDYTTFLHELGHALHFAHVDPAQPLEFRRMGDNGVTEGFAITFDHLMQLPQFLRRILAIERPDEFLRFAAFRELVMLRRYAAKFQYERSLHRLGPSPALAAEYAARLTEATGARTSAALYLEDVDPHFYCARYLRAWMLTGVLYAALRSRFDEDWFLNPRTGEFFRELWSLGQREPAEQLARDRLGGVELSFGPLLEMVHSRI
ncbi:MAG: hypothetical protein ABR559_08580 [Gemmatimonadota bacterium]